MRWIHRSPRLLKVPSQWWIKYICRLPCRLASDSVAVVQERLYYKWCVMERTRIPSSFYWYQPYLEKYRRKQDVSTDNIFPNFSIGTQLLIICTLSNKLLIFLLIMTFDLCFKWLMFISIHHFLYPLSSRQKIYVTNACTCNFTPWQQALDVLLFICIH